MGIISITTGRKQELMFLVCSKRYMCELILQVQYTLDGFVSGPNGELDWVFPDLDEEIAEWETKKL